MALGNSPKPSPKADFPLRFQLSDPGFKGLDGLFRPKAPGSPFGQVIGFGMDTDRYPETIIEITNAFH
jgi:hypothetical protein